MQKMVLYKKTYQQLSLANLILNYSYAYIYQDQLIQSFLDNHLSIATLHLFLFFKNFYLIHQISLKIVILKVLLLLQLNKLEEDFHFAFRANQIISNFLAIIQDPHQVYNLLKLSLKEVYLFCIIFFHLLLQ
jgi:hypothetical protein